MAAMKGEIEELLRTGTTDPVMAYWPRTERPGNIGARFLESTLATGNAFLVGIGTEALAPDLRGVVGMSEEMIHSDHCHD